jgi:hypothetical protein
MLGTGRALKESESSNEYFRFLLTNSLLLIALAKRDFIGENMSALAISERCHCYGIILKSPKRHQADEILSYVPFLACTTFARMPSRDWDFGSASRMTQIPCAEHKIAIEMPVR